MGLSHDHCMRYGDIYFNWFLTEAGVVVITPEESVGERILGSCVLLISLIKIGQTSYTLV